MTISPRNARPTSTVLVMLLAGCPGDTTSSTTDAPPEATTTSTTSDERTTGGEPTTGSLTTTTPPPGTTSTTDPGETTDTTTGALDTGTSDASSSETDTADTGTGDTGTADTGTSGTSTEDTGESTDASTGESDGSSTGDMLDVCGDGVVGPREECDDGDAIDNNECSNACKLPTCDDDVWNGDEDYVDCGGSDCYPCDYVLLVAGNATKSVGGVYIDGVWTMTDIPVPTVDGIALTAGYKYGDLAVFRRTEMGEPQHNQLQYVTFFEGEWSAPKQVGSAKTRAEPSTSYNGYTYLTYQGEDSKHYYGRFDFDTWSLTAEPIDSASAGPGRIADHQWGDSLFAFHDSANSNRLTFRRHDMGVWQPPLLVDPDTAMADHTPALMAVTPDIALAVHLRNGDGELRWLQNIGQNSATAPETIEGPKASHTPTLLSFLSEGAMAYRGVDGRPYYSYFDGGKWFPVQLVADVQIHGSPAIARGTNNLEIELFYLDEATRTVWQVSQSMDVWTPPVQVLATPVEHVAAVHSRF